MIRKIIENYKSRAIARQLRKPSGSSARKVGEMMNKANAFLYNRTIEVMELRDGQSILEIGFGNGKMFSKFFEANKDLNITGIDYSAEMVWDAARLNEEKVNQNKLSVVEGSSDNLPFADGSFDKVVCINVAYFWDQPEHHLKEINRVLKPGGRFYATIRSRESMNMMPFTKFGFTTYSDESWKALVEGNGFILKEAIRINEPAVDFKGNSYEIHSYCMVNEKTAH